MSGAQFSRRVGPRVIHHTAATCSIESLSTLLHPYLVQKLLENDVCDVDEHLLHEPRVGGRSLVVVDGIVGFPVLRLELVPDEYVCVVDTFEVNYALISSFHP